MPDACARPSRKIECFYPWKKAVHWPFFPLCQGLTRFSCPDLFFLSTTFSRTKLLNRYLFQFLVFSQATTPEEQEYRLSTLISHHLRAEKVDTFREYWKTHEACCSAESCIDDGIQSLGTFTSNNSETLNSADSINNVPDAKRSLPWVDYVTTSMTKCRNFLFLGRERANTRSRIRVVCEISISVLQKQILILLNSCKLSRDR